MSEIPPSETAPSSGRGTGPVRYRATGRDRDREMDPAAGSRPTPDHIAAALVDAMAATAARVLSGEELDLVRIRFADDDGGPSVSIRGPIDLVDRIERAVYGEEATEGSGTVAAAPGGGGDIPSSARVGTGS